MSSPNNCLDVSNKVDASEPDAKSGKVAVDAPTEPDAKSGKVAVDAPTEPDAKSAEVAVDATTEPDAKSCEVTVDATTEPDAKSGEVTIDATTEPDAKSGEVAIDATTEPDAKSCEVTVDATTEPVDKSVTKSGAKPDTKPGAKSGSNSNKVKNSVQIAREERKAAALEKNKALDAARKHAERENETRQLVNRAAAKKATEEATERLHQQQVASKADTLSDLVGRIEERRICFSDIRAIEEFADKLTVTQMTRATAQISMLSLHMQQAHQNLVDANQVLLADNNMLLEKNAALSAAADQAAQQVVSDRTAHELLTAQQKQKYDALLHKSKKTEQELDRAKTAAGHVSQTLNDIRAEADKAIAEKVAAEAAADAANVISFNATQAKRVLETRLAECEVSLDSLSLEKAFERLIGIVSNEVTERATSTFDTMQAVKHTQDECYNKLCKSDASSRQMLSDKMRLASGDFIAATARNAEAQDDQQHLREMSAAKKQAICAEFAKSFVARVLRREEVSAQVPAQETALSQQFPPLGNPSCKAPTASTAPAEAPKMMSQLFTGEKTDDWFVSQGGKQPNPVPPRVVSNSRLPAKDQHAVEEFIEGLASGKTSVYSTQNKDYRQNLWSVKFELSFPEDSELAKLTTQSLRSTYHSDENPTKSIINIVTAAWTHCSNPNNNIDDSWTTMRAVNVLRKEMGHEEIKRSTTICIVDMRAVTSTYAVAYVNLFQPPQPQK